jgi:hypothetical protein
MAQRTVVTLLDDTDPSGETIADETVPFALDGVAYEIDLSTANAKTLRDVLGDYVKSARKAGKAPAASSPAKASGRKATQTATSGGDRARSKASRHWLTTNGYTVNERGRIPNELASQVPAWVTEDPQSYLAQNNLD